MKQETHDIEKQIKKLEEDLAHPLFWNDKIKAQAVLKELRELRINQASVRKYDKGNAILTIISGAGGDDAEDFSAMLLSMYMKYIDKKRWEIVFIHENKNDHSVYRNITIEISGKNVYGTLKNESGVRRLVRVSPFSSKKLRHTSFSLVEVIPKFDKVTELEIPDKEIRLEFSRSSGPGGQNVNKRETAVRVVHIPTNMAV